jgi:hypothetical protein
MFKNKDLEQYSQWIEYWMSKIQHSGAVVEHSSGESAERADRTLFAPPTNLPSRQKPAAIRLES